MEIGDWVLIKAVLYADYPEVNVVNHKSRPIVPVIGIVTGRSIRYNGTIEHPPYDPETSQSNYLAVSATVKCLLVRTGEYNREIPVLESDLELIEPSAIPRMSRRVIYVKEKE